MSNIQKKKIKQKKNTKEPLRVYFTKEKLLKKTKEKILKKQKNLQKKKLEETKDVKTQKQNQTKDYIYTKVIYKYKRI